MTEPAQRSTLREYIEALLVAALFLGYSNTYVVKTFFIPSGSMEDTLLIGDHLFVNRFIFGQASSSWERRLLPLREPRRGDIVVFRSPERPTLDLVKRLIGLPGDTIEIRNKQLFINGQPAMESAYVRFKDPFTYPAAPFLDEIRRRRDNFGPVTVPEGHYFCLGDNRDHSQDSRYWGMVPRRYLKGRPFLIYWSYGGETSDGSWPGFGAKLLQLGRTLWGLPTKTRWSRTFHLPR